MSETTTTVPSIEAIRDAAAEVFQSISAILDQLPSPLPETPDEGGWTVRQALSHVIGAYQRVPIHAGFFTGPESAVPVTIHDPYWISEWETAPIDSFRLAVTAAYTGSIEVISSFDEARLAQIGTTPFGPMALGDFLMLSMAGHLAQFHIPQLAAFTGK
jgi:hypothetical protein